MRKLQSGISSSYVFLLVEVLAVYLVARYSRPPHFYARWFTMSSIVQVCSALLVAAVGTPSLPSALKQSIGNPYLRFITIAIASYAVLTISLAVLMAGFHGVTLQQVLSIREGMFDYTRFKAILSGRGGTLRVLDYVSASIGLLYSYTVADALLKWKKFKRTDEDYIAMASASMFLRQFTTVLALLEKVKNRTAVVYKLKAAAYVGVGWVEDARKLAAVAGSMVDEHDPYGPHGWLYIACLPFPLDQTILNRLLSKWLANGAPDYLVCGMFHAFLDVSRISVEEINGQLDAVSNNGYPLTRAMLAMAGRDFTEAKKLLQKLDDDTPLSRTIRRCFLTIAESGEDGTGLEEQYRLFTEWLDVELPAIGKDFEAIENDSERIAAIMAVMSLVVFVEMFACKRIEEVRFQISRMKAKIQSEEGRSLVEVQEAAVREKLKRIRRLCASALK